MKNSLGYIVLQLLSHNNISIDKKELEFQIESHSSYPSLHAITGVLDHFNIDNIALDVPKSEEILSQLPKTFLSQIEAVNGKEFVVAKNNGLNYQLINSSKNKETVSINEFLKRFTGIIVGVEKTEFTEESRKSNSFYDRTLIVSSILVSLGMFFLLKPSFSSILFLITSLIGLIISITIKKQEQGQNTVLGSTFCSGETEKKDCNAVLTSKGATLFKKFKLSDISIIYFLVLSFTTLTLIALNKNLAIPFLISLLAIPVTFYSIYYQAIAIKKWCLLCLSIVCILWMQSIFSLLNLNASSLVINSDLLISILVTVTIFFIVAIVYNYLSSQLEELYTLKGIKVDFYKFKRNFTLFNSLLEKSKPISTKINHDFSGIILGNPEAQLQITVITNPFCGYCKPVHTLVEDIYKKYSKDVMLQIRFNSNPNDIDSKSTRVVTRLLELYQINGLEFCMHAMHSIYNNQDEKLWLEQFGECSDLDYYCSILDEQYTWCVDNNINFTPEILINGKSYPNQYDRSDLILFIEDLHESCCIDTTDIQLTT